jgi:peptidoglycan-associated lipoprotein
MKRLKIIFFLSFVFTSALFGQSKNNSSLIAKADKYYQSSDYFMAAHEYQRVAFSDTSNTYITAQLAECYRYLYDYKNAEPLYQKLSLKDKAKYPTARFWYATILKDNGEFDPAINNFEAFRNETEQNSDFELELYKEKAKQEISDCKILSSEERKEVIKNHGFRRLPEPVNSPAADFAPVLGENDSSLVITSAKAHGSNSGPEGHTDVHRFIKLSGDTIWQPISHTHQDKFSSLNTHYSESSGSFTADKTKYYFTRCDDQIVMDNHREFNCAIYVSYNTNGKWAAPARLNENINAPGQWNAQPCVSPDGSLLFFVSKRPGGAGMHDIWLSTSNGDDQWLPPQNLYGINTLYMDVSPKFIASENTLFFSSSGLGGYGGLDVFMTKAEDQFSKIYHLKKPFNSNRDDFFFTPGKKKGYLSSNRKGGFGNDDIYSFDIEKNLTDFIQEIMSQSK